MNQRYILTGAPGAGKTSVIKELENRQFHVTHEAATDFILQQQKVGVAEPWLELDFIDQIIHLQQKRQEQADHQQSLDNLQFYDRSPICTYALAQYLGLEYSKALLNEIDRVLTNKIYEKRVFFFKNLGFIENNDIRRISFKESLKFEEMHIKAYDKFGYKLEMVELDSIKNRAKFIVNLLSKYKL